MEHFISAVMMILMTLSPFSSLCVNTFSNGFAVIKQNVQEEIERVSPENISGLKAESRSPESIVLSWNLSKRATEYVLFRSEEKADGTMSKYKKYATVSDADETSYTDGGLESGRLYGYKLYACHKDGKYTVHTPAVKAKAFTKIPAVKGLRLKKATPGYISLRWNSAKGAEKYLLYRKSPGSGYKYIAVTDRPEYKDGRITSGCSYQYKVVGFRTLDGKSYKSKGRTVSVKSGVTSVKGVTAKTCLSRALLTWEPVSGASGYGVFAKGSKGKYKLVQNVKNRAFLSQKGKPGETCEYAIKAYNLNRGRKSYAKPKYIKVTLSGKAYGKSAGRTYIEICKETQRMYMYDDNKLYCSTPVVTGMYNSQDTHNGFYRVISRKSPARLRGSANGHSWDVTVKYWLGFTYDGQGVHDSSWRRSGYGGEIYKGDGSNGCVNTPLDAVSKIYGKAYAGMPVIVY